MSSHKINNRSPSALLRQKASQRTKHCHFIANSYLLIKFAGNLWPKVNTSVYLLKFCLVCIHLSIKNFRLFSSKADDVFWPSLSLAIACSSHGF